MQTQEEETYGVRDSSGGLFSIIALGEADLPQILECRHLMMESCGMSKSLRSDWRELVHAHYEVEYRAGRCQHFGVFVDGGLIAVSGALIRTGFPYNTFVPPLGGWIMDVYVAPDYRGRGLSRALTRAAVSWLKGCQVVDIRLMASPQARAQRVYEPLGFAYTNEMKLVNETDAPCSCSGGAGQFEA